MSPESAQRLEALYRRFRARALEVARRLLRQDGEAAEDVVQDVFVALCALDRAPPDFSVVEGLIGAACRKLTNDRREERSWVGA